MVISPSGYVGIGIPAPTAALAVSGQAYSKTHDAGAGTTLDFANGNTIMTSAAAGAPTTITLRNMPDGGSYTVICTNGAAGTFDFTHSDVALTFKYVPTNGPIDTGKSTVYTFVRAGTIVYVSWVTGF